MNWILELSRPSDGNKDIYTHLGYLNKSFATREKACAYVDTTLELAGSSVRTKQYASTPKHWECLMTDGDILVTVRKHYLEELSIDSLGEWWRAPLTVTWMLEAQCCRWGKGFQHVGYVAWSWDTKQEAADFYKRMYPGMRDLNARGTWASDWSPIDGLRYVVRPWKHEYIEIDTCREELREERKFVGQRQMLMKMNKAVRLEHGLPEDY
ncbi:Hypothetical protein POVR2_LOCUS268 [uncultured virus]|nr:Hypothetical protein POVR2_LOCUS268 [uncultured virus]